MSIKVERHRAREIAVGTLYSLDIRANLPPAGDDWFLFQGLNEEEVDSLETGVKVYAQFLIEGTLLHLDECDSLIKLYSKRPIEMIDAVDRAILRISFFQLLYDKETHPTIVIDEAVKLSQELSNDVSFKFINGILDTFVRGKNDSIQK